MNCTVRKARQGDEKALAYIQTESWKAAFSAIIPAETLKAYTDIARAENKYARLLNENTRNTYILEVDGKPHCIACWGATREDDMPGYAELICIHSLQNRWHKGYGSCMMERVLCDIRSAGYDRVMLWVFEENTRAKGFYEKHGFAANGRQKEAFGSVEVMYEMCL